MSGRRSWRRAAGRIALVATMVGSLSGVAAVVVAPAAHALTEPITALYMSSPDQYNRAVRGHPVLFSGSDVVVSGDGWSVDLHHLVNGLPDYSLSLMAGTAQSFLSVGYYTGVTPTATPNTPTIFVLNQYCVAGGVANVLQNDFNGAGGSWRFAAWVSDACGLRGEMRVNSTIPLTALTFDVPASESAPTDPDVISFGTDAETRSLTVRSAGSQPVSLSAIRVDGAADFSLVGTTCPSVLAVDATCTMTVRFERTRAGSRLANLRWNDDAGTGGHVVRLAAGGLAANVIANPSSLTVTTSVNKTSDVHEIDLVNEGVEIGVVSLTIQGDDSFEGITDCAQSPDYGYAQVLEGCSLVFDFTPTVPGDHWLVILNKGVEIARVHGVATANLPPAGNAPSRDGYWMLGAGGELWIFGAIGGFGDARTSMAPALGIRAVKLEPTKSGRGYWIVDTFGRVYAYGDAKWYGNVDRSKLMAGEQVSSLSATPDGGGYWVFTNRGRVLVFGNAPFLGDMSNKVLNGPVLGSISTPSGNGYYLVASDGGIFAFGDAHFFGSMGGKKLNAPVQSLVPTRSGIGYWLVASDGGIFAFGDAPFRGSMGSTKLNEPVVGMVRYGNGYLMVGADGGIFAFSDRDFVGSLGGKPILNPIASVAAPDLG